MGMRKVSQSNGEKGSMGEGNENKIGYKRDGKGL